MNLEKKFLKVVSKLTDTKQTKKKEVIKKLSDEQLGLIVHCILKVPTSHPVLGKKCKKLIESTRQMVKMHRDMRPMLTMRTQELCFLLSHWICSLKEECLIAVLCQVPWKENPILYCRHWEIQLSPANMNYVCLVTSNGFHAKSLFFCRISEQVVMPIALDLKCPNWVSGNKNAKRLKNLEHAFNFDKCLDFNSGRATAAKFYKVCNNLFILHSFYIKIIWSQKCWTIKYNLTKKTKLLLVSGNWRITNFIVPRSRNARCHVRFEPDKYKNGYDIWRPFWTTATERLGYSRFSRRDRVFLLYRIYSTGFHQPPGFPVPHNR